MDNDKKYLSIYFFDIDDNIIFLNTPIFILNTQTGIEKKVNTGEFARIHSSLGQPGTWEDFAIFEGTFKEFRDIPAARIKKGEEQYFVRDIKEIASDPSERWQAPSWKLFVHACNQQRPLAFITARGHSPETIKSGIEQMKLAGKIKKTPNYLGVFPVGNNDVRKNELDDPGLIKSTPRLKKTAIMKTVDEAIRKYEHIENLHFGMSDDDPTNVNLIISAMRDCKIKYSKHRFFVMNTHFNEQYNIDQRVKLEIFPLDYPVT